MSRQADSPRIQQWLASAGAAYTTLIDNQAEQWKETPIAQRDQLHTVFLRKGADMRAAIRTLRESATSARLQHLGEGHQVRIDLVGPVMADLAANISISSKVSEKIEEAARKTAWQAFSTPLAAPQRNRIAALKEDLVTLRKDIRSLQKSRIDYYEACQTSTHAQGPARALEVSRDSLAQKVGQVLGQILALKSPSQVAIALDGASLEFTSALSELATASQAVETYLDRWASTYRKDQAESL